MQITDSSTNPSVNADFNGAAILDHNGQEVPITEDMVQGACSHLEVNEPES